MKARVEAQQNGNIEMYEACVAYSNSIHAMVGKILDDLAANLLQVNAQQSLCCLGK